MNEIQEYDLVALTEDAIATHKVTHQQILLRRGQMGTVLMSFDQKAFLIDFTDQEGNTFAMETIETVKLLRLINEPELVGCSIAAPAPILDHNHRETFN